MLNWGFSRGLWISNTGGKPRFRGGEAMQLSEPGVGPGGRGLGGVADNPPGIGKTDRIDRYSICLARVIPRYRRGGEN